MRFIKKLSFLSHFFFIYLIAKEFLLEGRMDVFEYGKNINTLPGSRQWHGIEWIVLELETLAGY